MTRATLSEGEARDTMTQGNYSCNVIFKRNALFAEGCGQARSGKDEKAGEERGFGEMTREVEE